MPDWRQYVRSQLGPLGAGGAREAEIVDELAQQLEECYTGALAKGACEDEALSSALEEVPDWPALAREIGAVEARVAEVPAPANGRLFSDFVQDVRCGLRVLRKSPGFTLLAVLTLALGIGATTAMFSIVSAVLLRPLPFARPDELVRVWSSWTDYPYGSVSEPELHDWRDQLKTVTGIAAYDTRSGANFSSGASEPTTVSLALSSANLFDVLGVRPALGRGFLPDENDRGRTSVVLLADGLWRRMFAADASVVGRNVWLQGESVTVVGVMPAGFAYPAADVDVWQPLVLDRHEPRSRGNHYLRVVARLAPQRGLREAAAELTLVARQLQAANPADYPAGSGFDIRLRPLREQMLGPIEPPLLLLLGAVGLVLAIACANVASLMLARGTGRGREIAIRSALGASRARIARQLLAESLLLAAVGGSAGVFAAHVGLPALLALAPDGLPRVSEVRIDGIVACVAALVTTFCGVAFGLVPAWQATRADAGRFLKSGRTGAGPFARRPQRLLVVTEMAIARVLLFGAGLLLRSFAELQHEEMGFDPNDVATASVMLPTARYPKHEEAARFFEHLRQALDATPGIVSAAVGNNPPLSGGANDNHIVIEGYTPRGPGDRPDPEYREVSPGYFRTLRIPLQSGRDFTVDDDTAHPPVAIISRALALKYWGAEDAVGHRVRLPHDDDPWITIVGVAGDVKQTSLSDPVLPTLYLPHLQVGRGSMTVFVRSSGDAHEGLAAVARSVHELDKGQAVAEPRPMQDLVAESLAVQRFNLRVLGLFAMLAVGLAGVGTFGVMRSIVEQQTAEIGIRMALGAGRMRVLHDVLREGLTLATLGVVLGAATSLALTRVIGTLSSLLHGVSASDAPTLAAVTLLLLGVAVIACWAPAWRATRVDPTVALRGE